MPTVATNPQAGDVHVNRPLTNFAQQYIQQDSSFVALRAFPNAPSVHQSDLYYEYDRDDWFRDEAEERADGTESAGGAFDLSSNPFFCRVYAYHKDVTDRQRANADPGINLDQQASRFVSQKLMIRREKLFADTFMVGGAWTGGGVTPSPLWSASTGDPIIDVREGKRVVQGRTGFRPNKAVIGRTALDTVLDNDAVLDRLKGGATRDIPALVLLQMLAELWELDQILVMDSIVTTSKKGAASTVRAFHAANDMLLYYAPDSVGMEGEPTAGTQFSWTGLHGNTPNGMRMKRFRNEPTSADRVEGEMAFDYKVTGADLGYYFSAVSS